MVIFLYKTIHFYLNNEQVIHEQKLETLQPEYLRNKFISKPQFNQLHD